MADIEKDRGPYSGTLLFVYGTLKRRSGEDGLHPLLKVRAEFVGQASVPGRLYDLGDYPGLYSVPEGGRVSGELYRLRDPGEAFRVLDEYEGCAEQSGGESEFIRVRGRVRTAFCAEAEAWMYVLGGEPHGRPHLEGGVF